jgi:DnaJ-class molecular chaperone
VLGTGPQASPGELRRNVALLLRWLHPDLDPHGELSVFIGRVTAAWNDLKTPERRMAYDDLQRRSNNQGKSGSQSGKSRAGRLTTSKPFANGGSSRNRFGGERPTMRGAQKIGFLRRALAVLFHRPL